MSQIPQLMSGRALEHGIAMAVDHGGTSSAKMYVGGQANADVAASSSHGGDSDATTETALASLVIPANALVAGSTIRVRASGMVIASSGLSLQAFLRFDGTATALASREAVLSTTDAAVATNDIWYIDALIQIRTATTAIAMISYQDPDITATATKMELKDEFAIDITASNTVSISTQWSATTGSNSCRNDIFVVDIVNPST